MCFRCLNTFNSNKSLASHNDYCKSYKAIKIELPDGNEHAIVKDFNDCVLHLAKYRNGSEIAEDDWRLVLYGFDLSNAYELGRLDVLAQRNYHRHTSYRMWLAEMRALLYVNIGVSSIEVFSIFRNDKVLKSTFRSGDESRRRILHY